MPSQERKFLTSGTMVLLAIMAVGFTFGVLRFVSGLGATTNLNDQYPWGIWVAINVESVVALAAGGFVTAALVNIFGRRRYHPIERSAILIAWLSYMAAGLGVVFDLGRYISTWHPLIYWQGNSVLFEIGMCVMFYLLVLTIEFSPVLIQGLLSQSGDDTAMSRFLTRISPALKTVRSVVRRAMPVFLIAGVVLSCMHQSALGTLMVIAPTKLSPLWWTPLLPLLFLVSAIMVGFPMVILVTILANRSFRREPRMDLLGGLGRIVPWFIGAYAILKFGDFFIRRADRALLLDAGDTVALFAEVAIGLVFPLILFSMKSVRRSAGWLLAASSMVVAGVLLNRINVFLVGFHPPFGELGYVPALGEIAITAAIIATVTLAFRFFAMYFPVLDDVATSTPWREAPVRQPGASGVPTWAARGLAGALMIAFIVVYAIVHSHGVGASERMFRELQYTETARGPAVEDPIGIPRQTSFSPETMPKVIMLNHALSNEKIDDYEAVRFLHKAHAARLGGDCSVCHHRVQRHEGDTIGVELEFTAMDDHRPTACVACHQRPNEPDHRTRPGVKAAFHLQCIGCHQEEASGWPTPGVFTTAPTECDACHHSWVPDHTEHMTFTGNPEDPREITARCLECHRKVGDDIVHSAHWTWMGSSPNTRGHEHDVTLGKRFISNNYCVHVRSNEQRCSQCHIGYGFEDESFDFTDPRGIDCLICHDTTGTYKKDPKRAGMPMPEVNLAMVARKVGRPSRQNCGICHFYGGGGANVKHGDLEPALVDPPDDFDVHMGLHDMRCQDCHTTFEHRIAGQCVALPTSEGRVTCEQCHGETPHALDAPLGAHLDKHAKSIACQTCHIPSFAKAAPTKLYWDWSKVGADLEEKKDQYGMPTFLKKKGTFVWGKDVNPCYAWYDGTHERVLPGQEIDTEGATVLNPPHGSIRDPKAKLAPFKCYGGIVPVDAKYRTLGIPRLWKGLWKHLDWKKALEEGMAELDQPFSGEVGFAHVDMYWGISHEVVPAGKALRCADCHEQEAVTCTRCHGPMDGVEPEELIRANYPDGPRKWADFEGFGYPGDPARTGGRFKTQPVPGGR